MQKILNYVSNVLENMPQGWLNITTHRLDIYNEKLAKTEFLEQFETLFLKNNTNTSDLDNLPTAYDYIRLGHPLSCVLEWTFAKKYDISENQVISFSSSTIPLMAVLRKNLLNQKTTQIYYIENLPNSFNEKILKEIYGYSFDLFKITDVSEIPNGNETTVLLSSNNTLEKVDLSSNVDFYIQLFTGLGSVLIANGNEEYISEIQHVRRRETIAMTPANCMVLLRAFVKNEIIPLPKELITETKQKVFNEINSITNTTNLPLVASSGLSIQYAILMGLIHYTKENHVGKEIRIVVPPNCYGGTNDQARRIAACINNVKIVDLLVDDGNDMVQSIHTALTTIANEDAVPLIIAEIPTNPRVEVPDLIKLQHVLSQKRTTKNGGEAVAPIFILDQTFCPNVTFLGKNEILSSVQTISFASGSKFPSGGLCTAGYCVGNEKTISLMEKIALHLSVCDNEATSLQYQILAKQLPSMLDRIAKAYTNTREFVGFIQEVLPEAKINFVSDELANNGFTPSVFSLDLPTVGDDEEEREMYKRALNLKLINLMITKIPTESKFCVSYGQLKGCYWTIPATSTQGTTKEGDKDYIVRASLSANLDLDLHKQVFLEFVKSV